VKKTFRVAQDGGQLFGVGLRLLDADQVGADGREPVQETFFLNGTDAVDVPGEEGEGFFRRHKDRLL